MMKQKDNLKKSKERLDRKGRWREREMLAYGWDG